MYHLLPRSQVKYIVQWCNCSQYALSICVLKCAKSYGISGLFKNFFFFSNPAKFQRYLISYFGKIHSPPTDATFSCMETVSIYSLKYVLCSKTEIHFTLSLQVELLSTNSKVSKLLALVCTKGQTKS